MHDIKAIRENPEAWVAGWSARGVEDAAGVVAEILKLDADLRAAQTAGQTALARRNESSKLIGAAKGRKDEAEAQRLMAEVEGLKADIEEFAVAEIAANRELQMRLANLPNIPAADVPPGEDEHGNVEKKRVGAPRTITAPRDHVDLGEGLGMMDFEAAARMSGARFVVLKKQLARLERAIGQFMLDLQTGEHGYTEVNPPVLVRDQALYGTGQLPKFEEDLFRTTSEHYLIPTAEVSLTNLVREQITAEEELPLRLTALTGCFRAEAGSAGRDTRGMIRQHQFFKVELVSITTPEQSDAEHERMVTCAEAVLERLELPYRRMLLCTGDMGFTARKTFDLEVWLPSQDTYREISSCSNCGDFQARRMDARIRKTGEKGTRFAHTLNGSGLAVGRTLVAIMENYQDEGGRIAIPDVLKPYMGGLSHIERA
ncbi:MAG: serine--tRNA ligase [Caulobacteraceae bacterium]|nr:serine--tRNA ligase [Caulobacteraceae bacterium]